MTYEESKAFSAKMRAEAEHLRSIPLALTPTVVEDHSRMSKAEKAKLKPGRFWARSSAGVHLNRNYTCGWRGPGAQR